MRRAEVCCSEVDEPDLVDAAESAADPHPGSFSLPRRRPGTPVVAVVFPDELLTGPDAPRIPVEAHDERVDAALTVDGLVRFGDALRY